MAAVAALAVVAICMSPIGNMLAARFDAAFVYISKVRYMRAVVIIQIYGECA